MRVRTMSMKNAAPVTEQGPLYTGLLHLSAAILAQEKLFLELFWNSHFQASGDGMKTK